jgi:hypothetical protein
MSAADLLQALPDDPDLVVEIADGIEHFRGGRIALRLHGSGDVEVIHSRAGDERRYEGRLEPERIREAGDRLAALGFDQLVERRAERGPDEGSVHLGLRRGDQILHAAELGGGLRHDDERLDEILRLYEGIVGETTEGLLPFGAGAAPR